MNAPTIRSQQGMSLLESLVAILIFSIGILAIVALQTTSIKATTEAKYRSDATYLTNQLIGRMWADRPNLASYAHYAGGNACAPTGSASAAAGTQAWLGSVAATLPGATAAKQQVIVTTDAATGVSTVTVNLCWTVGGEDRRQSTITQIAFGA